jgi:lincosamide nucleotidyltransferase A/C/D/E
VVYPLASLILPVYRQVMQTEPTHIMTAASAIELLKALSDGGADPCVGGGWAVDALIGEQTREHSDLDLWVQAPTWVC